MKNKIFILTLILFFKTGFAQYDYFKWAKTINLNTAGNTKAAGSGIAVDQFGRTMYLHLVGSDYRICWQYGDFLPAAASAEQKTNLIEYTDGVGQHVFYITKTNRIGLIEYLNANQYYTYNSNFSITEPVAQGPSIASSVANQVFYIRASDKVICNIYTYQGGVGFGPLNLSAPVAAVGSNIILNDGRVFYVTNTNKIGCIKWDWVSGWVNVTLPNAPGNNSILSGSKIQVTGNNSSFTVFYVGPDQKIKNYYCNPNNSGFGTVADAAQLANTNTDILTYPNEVRYVGTDGNIQSLFWNGCGWVNYTLNTTCSISDPAIAANAVSNKIFFYSGGNFWQLANQSTTSGFVYKQGNKLMLNGAPFYPIGINYLAYIYSADNGATFYPGPHPHYANNWTQVPFIDEATCKAGLDQHLAEIATLGFNSIRFNDLHLYTNGNDNTDPNLYINYKDPGQNGATHTKLVDQATINSLFQMYDYLLSRTAAYNLKVKFFIGLEGGQKNTNSMATYKAYLQQFANYFKNNANIYSYALLQEADNGALIHNTAPSVFRGKGDICYYMHDLYNTIRTYDSNHLINLSLVSSSSLFNFDPYVLSLNFYPSVDFISFHPYPYNSADNTYEEVRREMQWMSNIMTSRGQPWIIGETGYPGNNENPIIARAGSYADQKSYAQFALNEAFSAGACGFCWWNYKDIFFLTGNNPTTPPFAPSCVDPNLDNTYGPKCWDNFGNYTGIKAHDGTLKPIVGGPGVQPVSNVFLNYSPQMGCSPQYAPANYYNAANAPYSVSGMVTNGQPIKDAVIAVYSANWANVATTFSKPDGSYSLQTQYPIFDVRCTGPGFATQDYYYTVSPNQAPITANFLLNGVLCLQGQARPTGINENASNDENSQLTVFPNPSSGLFNLKANSGQKSNLLVHVTDLLGMSLLTKSYYRFEEEIIDLSAFNNGVYFIHVTGDSINEVKKVIKE